MTRASGAAAALGLWLACALHGCTQADLVARWVSSDSGAAAPDSGPRDAGRPDAGADAQALADAEVDAQVDAGVRCQPRSCSALQSQSALCAATGATVEVGDGCSSQASPLAFRYAVCSCSDLAMQAQLEVLGPGPASVAVNGDVNLGSGVQIDGALLIGGSLMSGAPVAQGGIFQHVAPGCDCSAANLLDVASLVAAHATDNDNASLGLSSDALNGFTTSPVLPELTCGRYYLQRIAGSAKLTLRARGRVALFVGENIELENDFTIDTSAGATVSIFVAGDDVHVAGQLQLGTSTSADVWALFGRAQTVDLGSANQSIAGPLYAPLADLVFKGSLQTLGPVFVKRVAPQGSLHVRYQSSLTAPAATSCSAP